MTHDSRANRDGKSVRRMGIAVLMAVGFLAIGLLGATSHDASAAAPPVTQCNNETTTNAGGQGVRCTITVTNYLTSSGTLAVTPASTVTMTKCTGAAGPIVAGGGACATVTTTTSGQPITAVQQCNGEANGGGGVIICTATVTNRFAGGPAVAPTAATVYQCVGSVITGTGAPGTCTPTNSAGITSVSAATIGQCNGTGNGGTSVGFTCTVGASTMTTTLPVNIDQCNGSTNGGGALTTCQATVTNITDAAVVPPVVVTPVAVPTVVAPPVVATPVVVPTVVVPPVVVPPVVAPVAVPAVPAPLVPIPAKTGNAGIVSPRGSSLVMIVLLGLIAAGVTLGGRTLMSRKS